MDIYLGSPCGAMRWGRDNKPAPIKGLPGGRMTGPEGRHLADKREAGGAGWLAVLSYSVPNMKKIPILSTTLVRLIYCQIGPVWGVMPQRD